MNAKLSPALSNGDLDAFWMPFTANRQFKANPRLLLRAEGMYYGRPTAARSSTGRRACGV